MSQGVKAKIIRVGNLTNRYSDLKFQPNYESNAFLKRFRAFTALGAFPEYMLPLYCEFSPVDETADAVIRIASHSSERNIFHVYSDKPVYFDRLLEYFKEDGIPMEVLSAEAFADKLKAAEADDSTKYIPEALVNDTDKDGRLVYDSNIHIVSGSSVGYLKKLGFEWPVIDNGYVSKYIQHFRTVNFIK